MFSCWQLRVWTVLKGNAHTSLSLLEFCKTFFAASLYTWTNFWYDFRSCFTGVRCCEVSCVQCSFWFAVYFFVLAAVSTTPRVGGDRRIAMLSLMSLRSRPLLDFIFCCTDSNSMRIINYFRTNWTEWEIPHMMITRRKLGISSGIGIVHAASSASSLTVLIAGFDLLIWTARMIHSASSLRKKIGDFQMFLNTVR